MTVLYLVRHGETEQSSRSAYSGLSEIPLTREGRRQAKRAGDELSAAGVDMIVSSPLRRAVETAGAIAAATGVAVQLDDRLREIDYGPLEGLDRAEAAERFASDYPAWRSQPFDHPVPGVEPFQTALDRARAATMGAAAHANRPVLVSHQGTLRLVLIALGRVSPADYFATFIGTGEVLAVDLSDSTVRDSLGTGQGTS